MNIIDRAYGLLDGITPGEWTIPVDGRTFVYAQTNAPPTGRPGDTEEERRCYIGALVAESLFNARDARFIAAAPQLVRELCAEIERLRGAR